MQIRQNVSSQHWAIHPEWTNFIRIIERNNWALSYTSKKRVETLMRTQIRESQPFFWFCMMAYQNPLLFTNKQKEFFETEFPITHKWICFQQENIDDESQLATILETFTAYENKQLNTISLLSTIYATLTITQQTNFRKAQWYQNVYRWLSFAALANLTKPQQDYVAEKHAETMICTAENTEAYRRMLGKIYRCRTNPLTAEQKIKMRDSYPEIDFLVDIISTDKLTSTVKRRRVVVDRFTPVENDRHQRASIASVAPDDNDSERDEDSSTFSYRDESSDSSKIGSSTSSSESSSSSSSSSSSTSSSSSSSSSEDDASETLVAIPPPPAPVDAVMIRPIVVSPISLFKSLRSDIAAIEDELLRRQAIRRAEASNQPDQIVLDPVMRHP